MIDDFPTRLKSLRKERRYTQLEVSSVAGVARNTYSGYENGDFMPSAETMAKIAGFLGVSTDYLISGKEEEKKPTDAFTALHSGVPLDVGSQLELILFYLKDGGLPVTYKGHKLTEDERAMIIDFIAPGVRILNKIHTLWGGGDNG